MEAYRRHLVIDNINKVVYIQIMENLLGNLRPKEVWDMVNKQWGTYVPAQMVKQLQECIEGGYEVKPFKNFGAMNEGYYIIQITEIGINVKEAIT